MQRSPRLSIVEILACTAGNAEPDQPLFSDCHLIPLVWKLPDPVSIQPRWLTPHLAVRLASLPLVSCMLPGTVNPKPVAWLATLVQLQVFNGNKRVPNHRVRLETNSVLGHQITDSHQSKHTFFGTLRLNWLYRTQTLVVATLLLELQQLTLC